MRKVSGIQIRNRECIVYQGATASVRSKGAVVVEVQWQGEQEGKLKERSDESKIKMAKENIQRGNEYVHK